MYKTWLCLSQVFPRGALDDHFSIFSDGTHLLRVNAFPLTDGSSSLFFRGTCLHGHTIIRCRIYDDPINYLDVLIDFSGCDLAECKKTPYHTKWTKTIFHLRMWPNQNTFWLNLLPAEWALSNFGRKCFQFAWCHKFFVLFRLYLYLCFCFFLYCTYQIVLTVVDTVAK